MDFQLRNHDGLTPLTGAHRESPGLDLHAFQLLKDFQLRNHDGFTPLT
jgi:hypothetical protein